MSMPRKKSENEEHKDSTTCMKNFVLFVFALVPFVVCVKFKRH